MVRTILSVILGVVAWVLIVSVLNWGLRAGIPGYHAAEPDGPFTLTMMIGRLTIATITSLATGALIRLIAPQSSWAVWVVGLIGLIAFIPDHIHVWTHFPVWYHAYFLLTFVPLLWIGSRLVPARNA